MKRIFPSMAALAYLTVLATAQEQTVTIVSNDGQTVTIDGKTHKIEPGKPLTIQSKDGKTIRVVPALKPVTTRTTQLVLDEKGNMVRVPVEIVTYSTPVRLQGGQLTTVNTPVVVQGSKGLTTVRGPVTIQGSKGLTTIQGTKGLTTIKAPRTVQGSGHLSTPVVVQGRGGLSTAVTVNTRNLAPLAVQGGIKTPMTVVAPREVRFPTQAGGDDKEIMELQRKIAELQKQLHELMMKRHGGGKMVMPKEGGAFVMPKAGQGAWQLDGEHMKKLMELQKGHAFDEKEHKKMMELLQKDMGKFQWNDKQHKEFMELFQKQHKMDDKQHKELAERLQKEFGNKDKSMFQFDEKQHKEMVDKIQKEFGDKSKFTYQFDEKQHKEMIDKIQKEFGDKSKFRTDIYQQIDKEMIEKMKDQGVYYRIAPGEGRFYEGMVRQKVKGQKEAPKRFFDEPFFRTPDAEPQKGSGKPRKSSGKAVKADAFPAKTLKDAAFARSAGQRAREEAAVARQHALKESSAARAELATALKARAGKTGTGGAAAELKLRIAALEEQIRMLKEENARLKKGKTAPPPKVEVKSKRVG